VSPTEVGQILTGAGVLIAALASLWNVQVSRRNSRKIDEGTAVSASNSDKLDASHVQMNQRMDELINLNRKDATAIEKQRRMDER
jgi:hypothetical protein